MTRTDPPTYTPLAVGMRLETPLGPATILGFERFGRGLPGDRDYVQQGMVAEDNRGRVAVKLDNPDNWLGSKRGLIPYMFRSQCGTLIE